MPSSRSRHYRRGRYVRRRSRKRTSVLVAFYGYLFGVAVAVIVLGRLGVVEQRWLWVPVLTGAAVRSLQLRHRNRSRVSAKFPVGSTRSRHVPNQVKIAAALASNGLCAHCGADYDLAFDHIIPFNRGGSSTQASNIQILCRPCNSRKRDRYIG